MSWGCAVEIDLHNHLREVDAEDATAEFRAQWIEDNTADMVSRLLSMTDYRTEILADYYREADVAYAAALEGDAIRCASILANLLRKAADEDAAKLLAEFAKEAFQPHGRKYEDLPTASDVPTRWES